ncbi:methyl-accepting chemotaxis protein [Halocynthiibacter sp.]|uniref:methyl-accepting chemotaxis protein n=1 Tax=Halocynthiibacter sp. TaxID=1979210 RepID=UPI003C5CD558
MGFLRNRIGNANQDMALENTALIQALNKAQAVIWFDLEGNILDANDNFLQAVGYSLDEIKGKHHRIFVPPRIANSSEYKTFWSKLGSGKPNIDTFERVKKNGDPIWIEASYNPVLDHDGNPVKIVKFATDVTQTKLIEQNATGQLDAISKSQAVIEFTPTGTILSVNENFELAMGYSADEIIGKHHKMFVGPEYANSTDYSQFWERLADGEFQAGEFKRFAKGGREIWLQASYNPIFDADGNVTKVVKFASDITIEKLIAADARGQLSAISKSQAVIEFNLDGTIITANDNFLDALGYSLSEIQGQHHRIFVDDNTRQSDEYQRFWQSLKQGEFVGGEFMRITKDNQEIWIQATYNPIFDADGNPFKVVKFATDITRRVQVVETIARSLQQLSSGDLTISMNEDFPEEFERIRLDFNATVTSLLAAVKDIVSNTSSIRGDVTQISAASDDLATRTEKQAAALEETAAAVDELTASVLSATELAETAKRMSHDTKDSAQKSASVMSDTKAAMEKISDSSSKISRIIGVIDEISFQTNLLALNAGVEAARAGEAGLGFAVVAAEVRALAQRSSDAAREIAELISASADEVKNGVELVGNAGVTISEVEKLIIAISERVDEISSSSREQSTTLKEINTAINQLDQVTQENAAMFEESNAATQNLSQAVNTLSENTSSFQVESPGDNEELENWRQAQQSDAGIAENA